MGKLIELQEETKKYNLKVESILFEIEKSLKDMPENPAITKLNESGSCYTINSSELFKHDNWSVTFHNFRHQYEIIFEKLNSCINVERKIKELKSIIEIGKIKIGVRTERLHPKVIENLKQVL